MEHVFNHDWFQMIQSSLIFNPNYLNQIQKAKLNRFSKFVVFLFLGKFKINERPIRMIKGS